MAKMKAQDDSAEIRKLLGEIYKVIGHFNANADKTVQINRALLKTMAVVNDGFAGTEKDARSLFSEVNAMISDGVDITDEFFKKWVKTRGATNAMLDDMTDKLEAIGKLDVEAIRNSKDYIDLIETKYSLLDDELDLTKRLLTSHQSITKAIRDSKRSVDGLGGSIGNVETIVADMVKNKVNLSNLFSGMKSSLDDASRLIDEVGSDITAMINNVSGNVFDVQVKFNPITGELDSEVSKILASIEEEKDARLDALKAYFKENEALQSNLSRKFALEKLQSNLELNVEMPDLNLPELFQTLNLVPDLSVMKALSNVSIEPSMDMSAIESMKSAVKSALSEIKIDVDTGDVMTSIGVLKEGTKEYEALISKLDSIAAGSDVSSRLSAGFDEMNVLMKLGAKRTDEQEMKLRSLLEPLGMAGRMLSEQVDSHIQELGLMSAEVNKQRELHKTMSMYMGQLAHAEKIVLKIGSGFDYINGILPTGISDFLGISKISQTLIDSHRKGAEAFSIEIEKGADSSAAMASYFQQMGPAVSMALNPMLLLVAAAALLAKFVSTVTDMYKDMAATMNISLLQSKNLLAVQTDILTSQKNQFASMQDIQEVQAQMIESSGHLIGLNTKAGKELVISLSEMGKAFGYGNEKAAQIHKTFTDLGANDGLAKNLQENLGIMSELSGISPQVISQDMVDGAEALSTYFAGMPDKAARAVLQVRRMGMSLQKAGDIAQKMLDLEGFMTDMYELQAMSSGGIDFSKAFDKGLMGDIEGMTKDIMEEIGTTAEYNNMDYLTRMKIAKTIGMSVDELGKSVKMREQLGTLSDADKKNVEANLDRMGDISNLSKDEIKLRLQQLQSTDRLGVAWDKIKGVLLKSLLPLVESFASIIDMISPALDIIVIGFKVIGGAVGALATGISYLLKPLSFIGNYLSMGTAKLDEMGDSVNGLNGFLSGTLKVLAGLATVGIGMAAVKSIGLVETGLVDVLGKIPLVGKLFGGVGSIISSVFGGIFGMLGKIPMIGKVFSGMGGIVSNIFGGIGKKATDTVNASMTAVESLNAEIKTSIGSMVDAVKAAMDKVVLSIKESFKSISGTPIRPPVITDQVPMSGDVGKVTGKSKSTIIDVEAAANASIASVNLAADSATVAVEKVQSTTKKGFFKSDAAKNTFKTIGSLGASVFASIAVKSAAALLPMEESSKETFGTIAAMATPILGTAFSGVGDLLTKSLTEGVDRVFRKKIEKNLESKFDGPLSNVRKKFAGIGEPAEKSLKTVGETGQGALAKIKGMFKGLIPDSLMKKTTILPELDKIDPMPIEKLGDSIQTVTENVKKTKNVDELVKTSTSIDDSAAKTVRTRAKKISPPTVDIAPTQSKLKGFGDFMGSMFDGMADIVKKSWSMIKSTLLDIVDFAGDVLKSISSSVGESVKKLLTGIGEGLSSFKSSALKGAASLIVVSGALWITSKALQNFANVAWEDVGKGIVTLGLLTGAALALGKVSGQVIVGAASIALLGAALIPAAYALNKFNEVDWSSLAKAGTSIIGLGVIGGILGPLSPDLLLGAVAIAALGAALIPAAYALNQFNDVDWSSLAKAGVALVGLGVIGTVFGALSPVLIAASVGFAAFGASLYLVSGALDKFAAVDVGSMTDISKSMAGFGTAMGIFGALSPVILAGSVALTVGSLAVTVFGSAMSALNSTLSGIDPSPILEMQSALSQLESVDALSLLGLSGAILTLGASLATFNGMTALGDGLSKMFGGATTTDQLTSLASLSGPMDTLRASLTGIVAAMSALQTASSQKIETEIPNLEGLTRMGSYLGQFADVASKSQPTIDAISGTVSGLSASLSALNPERLKSVIGQISEVLKVDTSNLSALASGISAIATSLQSFVGASALSGISKMFGGDSVKDLERLANLADPLTVVALSIGSLSENIGNLSQMLSNVDLGGIEKLRDLEGVGIDTKITQQIEPLKDLQRVERESSRLEDVRISPTQVPLAKPFTPRQESVAQNVSVKEPSPQSVAQNVKIDPLKSYAPLIEKQQRDKTESTDIYGSDSISDNSKMEMLLMRIAQLLEVQVKQPFNVVMDGQKMATVQKKWNNNV